MAFPRFSAKGSPKRVIASWELLATFISLLASDRHGSYNGTLSGSTDYQGNTFAVDRLMSTKPTLAILFLRKLSEQLRSREVAPDWTWLPREQNAEADSLTNDICSDFNISNGIEIREDTLKFQVLDILHLACRNSLRVSLRTRSSERLTSLLQEKA